MMNTTHDSIILHPRNGYVIYTVYTLQCLLYRWLLARYKSKIETYNIVPQLSRYTLKRSGDVIGV